MRGRSLAIAEAPGFSATDFACAALVVAALSFNAVLAIVNGHVHTLGPLVVVACEVVIVACAHLVALTHFRSQMTPWYGLIAAFCLIALLRSFALDSIDVKFLRDVLLVPTFVILGLALPRRHLTVLVLVIHALVLAVMIFEALDTDHYAALFKIQDYYIDTRGYDVENFWNKESDLFVSATRPDERMFSFLDMHRLSSIFLEPVTLGNYCIVITAFVCARFEDLGRAAKWFLIAGNCAAIVGCDGRLAVVSSLIIIAAAVVAPRLPRHSNVAYLPLVVAAAFAVVLAAGFQDGPDNFQGRVAHTVELLRHYDLAEYLGLSDLYLPLAVDSGLAYLITTQSLLGVMLFWLFITLASPQRTVEQVRYGHGVSAYIALTSLVSFAFLSIKSAALLWFIYGAVNAAQPALAREAAPAAWLRARRRALALPRGETPRHA